MLFQQKLIGTRMFRRMLRPKWVPRVPERSLAGHLLEVVVTVADAGSALAAAGVRPL